MPIIVRGKSKCPLCGEVLDRGDDLIGFPAFLRRGHRYAFLSDAAMHRRCLDSWPEKDTFLAVLQRCRDACGTIPVELGREAGEALLNERYEEFWKREMEMEKE